MNLIDKWNKSHLGIPKDKSVSAYALEKEAEFPRNSTVLDLGGGTGVDAVYFAEKGHNVTLADISPLALEVAKEKAKNKDVNIKTEQVNIGKDPLPFEDSTFDIVYSRLVLHYFDKSTTSAIFSEINRILKKSGIAYITIKSPDDEKEMEYLKSNASEIEENVFLEEGDIKSRYSIEQLENILKEAGIENFEVIEYEEDLHGRVDKVKSGNKVLLLNEISWKK